ncbi:DgyrCDS12257 [Dimorphilus gyrociliatus]|uniref:DgyrCDS12257 n=1 Tax=Dimorphilus gyrociliatus TaxID=2664684 RepID=A0A7I8W746_9ANNE|nr:DgyrCDS12257 [Dimorphilus gyrociliatus]
MSTQYEQIPPWRREFLEKRQRAQEMERLRLESAAEKLASVPSWKRGLLEKKKQQMNSVVYTDKEGNGTTVNGYGNHSIEKEEHLLPVNQNPWVRSDTKIKHSNQPANNCKLISNNFNDSVFDDSENTEVEYGAGFVHKILQKFSHMSTNDSHPKRSHSTDSLDDRKTESKRRIQSERTDCVDQEPNKLPSKSVSVESLSSLANSPGRVPQSPLICRSSNKGSIPENERPKKNIVKSALSKFQTGPLSPPTYTKRSAPLPPPFLKKTDTTEKSNGFSNSSHSNDPCSQESFQHSLNNNANIPSHERDKNKKSLQNVMNNSTEVITEIVSVTEEVKKEESPREPTKPAKQNHSKTRKTNIYDSAQERTDRSHLILEFSHRNPEKNKNSTNKGGKPGKFSFGAASNVVPKTYNKLVLQTHLTKYDDIKDKNDEVRTLEDYKQQVDANEYENLQTNIDDLTSDDDDIPVTYIDDILAENEIDFIGANVKLNRNLLEKTKKPGSLRISFNDSEDIFEYPSEASLWQPERTKPIEPSNKPSKTFVDNPALRSTSSGTLGSYVSSTQVDYVWGERKPESQPIQSNNKNEEKISRQQESADHSWSETSRSSHLLF